MNRRGRRRDEEGQALVEFALVLHLIALLMAVAFNGWSGVQLALRLTSAARAGAIAAAPDLSHGAGEPLADATSAVNQEEDSTIYQSANAADDDYVSMTTDPNQTTSSGEIISVVTISISQASATLIPFVGNFTVTTHATAEYT
jgi:Flp pilus assembly protein TadG